MNRRELFNAPMNNLGLGGAFNRWFTNCGDGQKIEKKDILTLIEFMGLNPNLMTNKDTFICHKKDLPCRPNHFGFIKDSKSYKKLKQFLLDNQFDYKDWVHLLPDIETPKGKLPDLTLLDKDILGDQPFSIVTGVKKLRGPVQQLEYIYHPENQSQRKSTLSVNDVLGLNMDQITSVAYIKSYGKTLQVIQRKFKELGFTAEDGPFMQINFPNSKKRENYIEDLIKFKGFTRTRAIRAVNDGIDAGWIKI